MQFLFVFKHILNTKLEKYSLQNIYFLEKILK